jgi:endonuclease G
MIAGTGSSSMSMDKDLDASLIAKAREAVERWKARTSVREARTEALEKHLFLKADTPARLAARLNNLIDDVRQSTQGRSLPSNPTLKRLVERPMPVTADEISNEIVQEVVLATRDFLSVEFLERGAAATRSVGRVVIRSSGTFKARGTGVLVAPGLLLTNEHVLSSEALATRCALEMDYEQNRFGPAKKPQIFELHPNTFFLCDGALDYALVAVAPIGDLGSPIEAYGWLPLKGALGKVSISDIDYVNVVQHPLGREKEVVVRNNRVLDMRTADEKGGEDLGAFLHYEADTEKGSSGSPVLNDGWEIVGLHHSGVPATDEKGRWLDKDGLLWRDDQPVEDIKWIANEALRTSSLVAALANAPLDEIKRTYLKNALSAQPPAGVDPRTEATDSATRYTPDSPPPARRDVRMANNGGRRTDQSVTVEIPLRISVSLGDGALSGMLRRPIRAPVPTAALERLEASDFADRDGYDRKFIGVTVALPRMKKKPEFGGALVVPRPAREGDRIELRYHHYSVVMCAERRLAYVSACNLDFGAKATAGRNDGRTSWRTDPRLNADQQLANRFYDHNDYDKGHLTRRDDTAWGADLPAAIAANDDTFFYTNAAPQYYLFNQSDDFTNAGLNLWGDLENHLSEQGAKQKARLTVFNGPIFGTNDKPLHDALVPLRFFKIVVWRDEGETPGAVGFVLDQESLVKSLPEEAIDVGEFSIRQMPISDIEAELDIAFGKVGDWDRLLKSQGDEALDPDGILITNLRDIRL